MNTVIMGQMILAQMLYWKKSLLLLILLTSWSTQSTYYVTPTPDTPCLEEPCHTLSQYVTEQYFESFTGNVRMEFLPGNHTLEQTISLENLALTKLTLHGDSSSFPAVTSRIMLNICDSRGGLVFAGNTKLHISVLAFTSGACGGGIAILESEQQSDITYSIFQNIPLYVIKGILTATGNAFQNTESQALSAQYSTLKLTGNMFKNNSAAEGGALIAHGSTLNLIGNTFQENSATRGGALHVEDSTLNVTGNIFQNNSANDGGTLHVEDSTLNVTGNIFQNNSAGQGGALYVEDSTLNVTGNIFQNNSANDGGALYLEDSTLNLTGNMFQNNSAVSITVSQGLVISGHGGALSTWNSTHNLILNTFQENSAHYGTGGALRIEHGNLNLTENTFHNNSDALEGGALYVMYSALTSQGTHSITILLPGEERFMYLSAFS